ncbi:MAG: methylated-DNA--[protein]-cysteine S-methyltransferase [Rhodospirillales bacterium]|nr:methylated-DNA--[protein]-cysteine S-methyltransferase [Rhodospirillales bacterium]
MNQTLYETQSLDYRRIERAVCFIVENRQEQPSLEEIAGAAHVSPFHFQRLFTSWAGVSPKRFMGYLTLEHAWSMLLDDCSVLETSFEAGLSGPGRLHDLFINFDAVSPGDVKRRGKGLTIRYGIHCSPFGQVLIGLTDRGICRLSFLDDAGNEPIDSLDECLPAAKFVHAPAETARVVDRIFHSDCGRESDPLNLHVTGTNFQIKVWEALLRLPLGRMATYSQLCSAIGHPGAAGAVGGAVNANPVAFLIPCHSVVPMLRQASCILSRASLPASYQGDAVRRAAIIGWESARADCATAGPAPTNGQYSQTKGAA